MAEPDVKVPEVYADQFFVTVSVYTILMSFGLNSMPSGPGAPLQPVEQCKVRMSPQHAKVLAMILRRQLKTFERDSGTEIGLPHEVLNSLSLSAEDW